MYYQKIDSVYKREDSGKFIPEFSKPEFEYLYNNEWVGTEKVDGTNISIGYLDGEVSKRGRTTKAEIPKHLDKRLDEIIASIDFKEKFKDADVFLFGEGYGHKIQKAGKFYLGQEVDFILFDVKIGRWWLKREDVDHIAQELGLKSVPVVFQGTLGEAEIMVSKGFRSKLGELDAEGLVLTPKTGLIARSGERIITKIKCTDFRKGHYENIRDC